MTIYHGDNNHSAQKEPRETGFDWQKSPAHLRLLSKFLHPQVAEDFSKRSGYWEKQLGETPQKAIERFLDEGVLVHADLSEHLASKFKVTELKSMLKLRGLPVSGHKSELVSRLVQADPEGIKAIAIEGLAYKLKVTELKSMLKQHCLPVSGRKSELISRLVQADPEGMEKAVTKLTLLHCSERGRETVGREIKKAAIKHSRKYRGRAQDRVRPMGLGSIIMYGVIGMALVATLAAGIKDILKEILSKPDWDYFRWFLIGGGAMAFCACGGWYMMRKSVEGWRNRREFKYRSTTSRAVVLHCWREIHHDTEFGGYLYTHFVIVRFQAVRTGAPAKKVTLKAKVRGSLHGRLGKGSSLEIRYAEANPCVALLEGEF